MAKKTLAFTPSQAEKATAKLNDWSLNKTATTITKKFEFKDFVSALAFCAKAAVHAEVLNHHPDINLSHSTVKLKITTHDLKGLTKQDVDLAKRIDGLKL